MALLYHRKKHRRTGLAPRVIQGRDTNQYIGRKMPGHCPRGHSPSPPPPPATRIRGHAYRLQVLTKYIARSLPVEPRSRRKRAHGLAREGPMLVSALHLISRHVFGFNGYASVKIQWHHWMILLTSTLYNVYNHVYRWDILKHQFWKKFHVFGLLFFFLRRGGGGMGGKTHESLNSD